jgi:hypothetical protein
MVRDIGTPILRSTGGARLRDVCAPGALFVWRGQRSEKASHVGVVYASRCAHIQYCFHHTQINWGVVDKDAQALAPGVTVRQSSAPHRCSYSTCCNAFVRTGLSLKLPLYANLGDAPRRPGRDREAHRTQDCRAGERPFILFIPSSTGTSQCCGHVNEGVMCIKR